MIGIDARAAAEVPAGRGRYVRELLRALDALDGDETYLLYCREAADLGLGERFRWVAVPAADPWWHLRTAVLASRACDVYLSTNSYLTTWFAWCPTATTVHDLVAFRSDAPARRSSERIEKATIRPALRRTRRLLCVSEATRADLAARWPATAGKSVTIPLAADALFAAALPSPADRPYVLTVGTLEPRKNLTRLLDAWASLAPEERGEHELLVVGPKGWEQEEVLRRAHGAPGVRLLGHVSDAELASLYAGSTVFAYPSLYEGFGLPVLEAMAAGATVLTSAVSSLPEVAGDAALLVDPTDVEAIRAGLARLLGDPALRARLAEAGRARATGFSWARTAAATLVQLRALAIGTRRAQRRRARA